MLVDVLPQVPREPVADGILLYRFTSDGGAAPGEYIPDKNRPARQRFELFFCRSGSLTLRRAHHADVEINREDVVLLSDFSDLSAIVVQESLSGCCLAIDPEISSVFGQIFRALGDVLWNREQVQSFLQAHSGYLQIKYGSWSQSVFSVLHSLPDAEHGSYCVLKAAELFYLLNSHQAWLHDVRCQPAMPSYLVELLHCVGTYIENHLDEKLTISLLCHQFNLAPTTLKNKFRELYGQPIHSWILHCRVQQAAKLLQTTDLTVLQIAQSVGYESASQFNVVFRRVYGIAPSAYRKNVRYQKESADSVGNGHAPII